jgi:transposase
VRDRQDLSDEEWALLEPLPPDRSPQRSRPWKDHRTVMNGVLWRTATGVGPVVAARIQADVGDVARFADCNRFASWGSIGDCYDTR